jgi:hypothetical protein
MEPPFIVELDVNHANAGVFIAIRKRANLEAEAEELVACAEELGLGLRSS